MSRRSAHWSACLVVALFPPLIPGVFFNVQTDTILDNEKRSAIVTAIAHEIENNYVFPERAEEMARLLRERDSSHRYDGLTESEGLVKQLTADLYEVAHDRHIKVFPPDDGKHNSFLDFENHEQSDAWVNEGFIEARRLAGNVGLLKVDRLLATDAAADAANAAMSFFAYAGALIIDLRDNHGGSPEMIRLLCTYLFGPDRHVHLNDFQWRGQSGLVESYTLASIPGKSFADKPVFVLTSHHTFSGAEELAYDLQSLRRATIIGEVTGGGANPGRIFQLPQGFSIFIPTGRAINPVTKTNWEGIGVKPDIEVPEALALDTAHLAALRATAKSSRLYPAEQQEVRDAIKSLEARTLQ
jgi:hypothetical protein